jgi:predicted nucleotidyltransferase
MSNFAKSKKVSNMDAPLVQTLRNYFATSPVKKAWIFGSYSRGTQKADSDIDIMVTLDESRPVGMKFFAMYVELKELLGREVDLVTEESILPWAKDAINKDKKLIYERAN